MDGGFTPENLEAIGFKKALTDEGDTYYERNGVIIQFKRIAGIPYITGNTLPIAPILKEIAETN